MRHAPLAAGLVACFAAAASLLVLSDRLASRDAAFADAKARREDCERRRDALSERCDQLLIARREALARVAELERDLATLRERCRRAESSLAEATASRADAERVRDTVQAELLAAQDRLEKAYKDIAEMEKQIVQVSKEKNRLEGEYRRGTPPPDPRPRPEKIDGVVLGVSNKVNLVLISVGARDEVEVGDSFVVRRNGEFVALIVVDRVDDTWSACRVLEGKLSDVENGDSVSTAR